jgi:hypothetical protein
VTDITERLRQARENREAQRRLIASLDEKVRRRRVEMEQTLSDLSPPQRNPIIARATSSLRGDLRRTSIDARRSHLQQAVENERYAQAVRAHYGSPAQMLMRQTLGSQRRGLLSQQIEKSGPAELASLAEYAAATKDEELAAALCSRNSSVKPGERSFSSQDLADVLFGEKHRQVVASLLQIERLTAEALEDDRSFDNGRKTTGASIKIALMQRDEDEVGAQLPAVIEKPKAVNQETAE